MTTVEQVYHATIRPLSASERLQIARMILDDIPNDSLVDFDDDWSDEDLRDATRYSVLRAQELDEVESDAA